MTQTAMVVAKDYELDEAKAQEIQLSFEPMIAERKALAKEYELIILEDITDDVSKRAGALRRQLVKVRTGLAGIHKTQKAMFLSACRFIDDWKKAQTLPGTQMEEKLAGIEQHAANIAKAKREKIREGRVAELRKYGVSDEQFPMGLGQMEDIVWCNYIHGVKEIYTQRQESERIAEEERIAKEKEEAEARAAKEKADAEERERIRVENVKLKKEADAREKAETARKAKEAKERKKVEDAARKDREALEQMEKEQADKDEQARKYAEDTKARLADKKHRDKVDAAIIDCIREVDNSITKASAGVIVNSIAAGCFPNVTINY